MKEDEFTIASGHLDVGTGHKIYWQDWGNPKAKTPIFYLHGGPGSGSKDHYKLTFDPKIHRVVFHDQRGAGQSQPFATTTHNTTQDLVEDINKLRRHLKIDNIMLCGGSWGSTLALCYAIANPDVVEKMLVYSIYLGRKQDNDFLYQRTGTHFPDLQARFLSLVPKTKQNDVVSYYDKKFSDPDPAVAARFVKEWVLYEHSLMYLDANIDKYKLDAEENDELALALAKLETHYFTHDNFLPDNYILKNAAKLTNIPIVLVHGRYDFVCTPNGAYELKEALGKNAYLHVLSGGHSASETTYREVLKAYARVFL